MHALALKDQRTNDQGLTKMAVDAATVRAAVETAGERAGAVGDCDGVASFCDRGSHRRGVNCHFGQPVVVFALVF